MKRISILIIAGVLFVGAIDFTLKIENVFYCFLVNLICGWAFCGSWLYLLYRYDLKKQKPIKIHWLGATDTPDNEGTVIKPNDKEEKWIKQ